MPQPSGPSLILPVEPTTRTARGDLDLYLPDGVASAPAVLLVHGLYPEQPEVTPRNSNFYRDYASHLARRGLTAAVVDHDLTRGPFYPDALATVTRALDELRSQPEADGGSVGLWFFSGGGPLAYPFLADPAPWLRAVNLTYPVLPEADTPGWPDPLDAVAGLSSVPTFATLVEHEVTDFVAGQRAFVDLAAAAAAPLTIRTVAGVGHGFDALSDLPDARAAVAEALDSIVGTLLAS